MNALMKRRIALASPRRQLLGAFALASLTLATTTAFAAPPAQLPSRRPPIDPIRTGEKHEMEVTYMGIPGLHVTFEVLPYDVIDGRKVYHVRGVVETSSLVNLFFHLDDSAESWIDFESLFTRKLTMVQNQTDIKRVTSEIFDPSTLHTTFTNHEQKPGEAPHDSLKVADAPPLSQDTFSAFYYLRTLPLTVGASYDVPVVSEGNTIKVRATVLGVENIDVRFHLISSLIIKLDKLDPSGQPMPGTENVVWLSNDDQRILTRVDVKTRFGHVIAHLRKFTPGTGPVQAAQGANYRSPAISGQ
jgi:hypothetical protein